MAELCYHLIYEKARNKCDCVQRAMGDIDNAARLVKTVLDEVQSEWKGEAGAAAYEALQNWYIEIRRLHVDIEQTKAKMDRQALEVLTEWPQLYGELNV